MADAKFKLGDLVKSTAGAVKMVVDAVDSPRSTGHDEHRYWCVWWIGSKMQRERLTESGLEPWVEPAAPTAPTTK